MKVLFDGDLIWWPPIYRKTVAKSEGESVRKC